MRGYSRILQKNESEAAVPAHFHETTIKKYVIFGLI